MFSPLTSSLSLVASVVGVGVGTFVLINNESLGSVADIYPAACSLAVLFLLALFSLGYGVIAWCIKQASVLHAACVVLSIVALLTLGVGFILVVT